MFSLSFKKWLQLEVNAAEYDKRFKKRANRSQESRHGDLDYLFPQGKDRFVIKPKNIQIPAQAHAIMDPDKVSWDDRDVLQLLKTHGYEVTDYQGGYVRRGKGVEKIGGVLNRLASQATDPQQKASIQNALKRFSTSITRQHKTADNLNIIISKNPHDIAQMSFDRNWKSCMDLDGGQKCNVPFAAIRSGVIVAYLVNMKPDELQKLLENPGMYIDSKKAIARVNIRPAKDKDGNVIGALERRVYPFNVKGFWETIYDWLENHQSSHPEGRYRTKGGYSDTFGGDGDRGGYTHAPRDHGTLWKYLVSGHSNKQEAALQHIFNSRIDYPKPIWEKAKEILASGVYNSLAEYQMHDYEKMLIYLIQHKPEMFTDEEIKKYPFHVKRYLNKSSDVDTKVRNLFLNSMNGRISKMAVMKPLEPNKLTEVLSLMDDITSGKVKPTDTHILRYFIEWLNDFKDLKDKLTKVNDKDRESLRQNYFGRLDQVKVVGRKFMAMLANLSTNNFTDSQRNVYVGQTVINILQNDPTVEVVKHLPSVIKRWNMQHNHYYGKEIYKAYRDAEASKGFTKELDELFKNVLYDFYPSVLSRPTQRYY